MGRVKLFVFSAEHGLHLLAHVEEAEIEQHKEVLQDAEHHNQNDNPAHILFTINIHCLLIQIDVDKEEQTDKQDNFINDCCSLLVFFLVRTDDHKVAYHTNDGCGAYEALE